MINFFDINSVAIIGASEVEGKIGNTLVNNLVNFSGNKYGVNPRGGTYKEIDFYKSISLLPEIIDVAVFAIKSDLVEKSLIEAGEKGIKRVIIISAGFKEIGNIELENRLKEISKQYGISLLGPNCLGYFDVYNDLNLSFGTKDIKKGNIGIISQSGAMAVALTDWANKNNLGFSKIISMGNKAGIDEVDLLLELESDEKTKVIALYLESLEKGELFYEVARRISKSKPIIIIKSGVSALGQKAAVSHTGALSSDSKILKTAFFHSGLHSTNSLGDFFSMIEIFSKVDYKDIPEELAIITNAGGPGVISTDHCEFNDVVLTQFSTNEKEALKTNLSSSASVSNPIDIIGDATSQTYEQILNNFSKIVKKRAILLLLTPQSVTDVDNIAGSICKYNIENNDLLFVSFMGGNLVDSGIEILKKAGVKHFNFPEKAIFLYSLLLKQKKWELEEIKKSPKLELPKNIELLKEKISSQEKFCSNYLTNEILESFDINYSKEILVNSIQEVEDVFLKLNSPLLAARISSPDIPHKSDVGGVVLNISGLEEAKNAYKKILENISKNCKDAKISGVTLSKMLVKDRTTQEIFVGFKRDNSFGNIIFVGLGGLYVNIFEDVSMRVGLVSKDEIMLMLKELISFPILAGTRGISGINFDSLVDMIFKLQFVFKEFKSISEIDINPIFSSSFESIIVDAKFYL
ncbi:MAG: acetate--CoA ligase family protein [Candidatus Gracilibacteria bacterium]|nr:acetate--CoA ligase family protein [Candidatus Gracilibacteria bacterium]